LFDEDFQSYCHQVADKRVPGSYVTLQTPGHLDSGFYLRSEGSDRTYLQLNVSCAPWAAPNTIPFAESIGVCNYDAATQEVRWSFATDAAYVCPRRLQVGYVPTDPRAAPPTSNVVQQLSVASFVNGSHVGIDLKKLHYLRGRSIVEYDMHYHRAEWHVSPWDLISCPKGKNCGTYQQEEANIWKCVGEAQLENCFPLGDKRYNLTADFINRSNDLAGIKFVYGGGASGYSVHVYFQCNNTTRTGVLASTTSSVRTRQS
jgi:hypothetical protein